MYTCDYFVAALRCPACGANSPADSSTNMKTYLRSDPQVDLLGVGATVDLDPEIIRKNGYREHGYWTVFAPATRNEIRILQNWECPTCASPDPWAEIIITNGVIQSITVVPLNREILSLIHLISNRVVDLAAKLAHCSVDDLIGKDVVSIVRDHLS